MIKNPGSVDIRLILGLEHRVYSRSLEHLEIAGRREGVQKQNNGAASKGHNLSELTVAEAETIRVINVGL